MRLFQKVEVISKSYLNFPKLFHSEQTVDAEFIGKSLYWFSRFRFQSLCINFCKTVASSFLVESTIAGGKLGQLSRVEIEIPN